MLYFYLLNQAALFMGPLQTNLGVALWPRHLGETVVVVQLLSHVPLFVNPWTAARQASLSITNCQSLFKLMSFESVMPSNHLILRHPLLLPPSIFFSIKVFSNELALSIKWPKYWSFSFSTNICNKYSFRIDWFDLLAVKETLKSFLQNHISKTSTL